MCSKTLLLRQIGCARFAKNGPIWLGNRPAKEPPPTTTTTRNEKDWVDIENQKWVGWRLLGAIMNRINRPLSLN